MRRYGPTNVCDGAQMEIFGDFFASRIFSEPRAAHFKPALKFALGPRRSMVEIQSVAAKIRRGKKKIDRR